jgi:hypothetical protein
MGSHCCKSHDEIGNFDIISDTLKAKNWEALEESIME